MSLLTDLQNVVNNTQTNELNTSATFFANAGQQGIYAYFKGQAQQGKTYAILHFEKDVNPHNRKSGFATLSGELSIRNAEPEIGAQNRNDIGWVYMSIPSTTEAQFQAAVTDILNWLTTEGLTLTNTELGSNMADTQVNW
jgi:hypothetical protein